MLWPSELVGLITAVHNGYRAIRPHEAALAWFIHRPEPRWRALHDGRFAHFDHGVTNVRFGLPDKGNRPFLLSGPLYDIFGAGPGLTKTSTAADKPNEPIPWWR